MFPDDQIEWTQVEATCIEREPKTSIHAKSFRPAIGLIGTYYGNGTYEKGLLRSVQGIKEYHWIQDFLYNNGKDPVNKLTMISYGDAIGRGTKEFLIEPSTMDVRRLEVNVMLTVKLRSMDKPLVYTRSYVPDIKYTDKLAEQEKIYAAIKAKDLGKQKNRDLYDHQTRRIFGLLKWGNYNFGGKLTNIRGNQPGVEKLFDNAIWDGDGSIDYDAWCNFVWIPEVLTLGTYPAAAFFEFEKPVKALGYELYSKGSLDVWDMLTWDEKFLRKPHEAFYYTPTCWRVLAHPKAPKPTDEYWTILSQYYGKELVDDRSSNNTFYFDNDTRNKYWQSFTVEFANARLSSEQKNKVILPEFRLIFYGE